ncbi:MAG: LPS assembly protein LptD [Thermoanaerobaculia bacterium]|nr:LPS assembly protein LptD [Thermoanaerobaculia bacterium]
MPSTPSKRSNRPAPTRNLPPSAVATETLSRWTALLAVAVAGLSFAAWTAVPSRAQAVPEIESAASEEQPAQTTDSTEVEAAPAEEQWPDGVTFDVRLSAAAGGGRVTGVAGDFDFEPERFLVATDGVILKYGDMRLEADRIRVDIPANVMTAEGNVILDEGPRRLVGEVLEWDLGARTGRVTRASAHVSSDYFFSGAEIRKTGPDTYTVTDGVFTACEGESPSWSIALTRAEVTMDAYARIRNARVKFKSLPVFYVPYMLWPATTERTSGWLVPKPGYSERRGAELSLAYYQTLGRSADTTFFFDLSSNEFFGIGNEVRYRPSETTAGVLRAYYLTEPEDAYDINQGDVFFDPDREPGDDRWKLTWSHDSKKLWGGWRGVVNLSLYSDFDYLKDIERSVANQTRAFVYSDAFLTRNVGPHSINVVVDQREWILGDQATDVRRQLPEAEYRLRQVQLGNAPIYFQMAANAHYFQIDREPPPPAEGEEPGEGFSIDYGRVDLAPLISVPLSTLPWLSMTVKLGGRFTYYTDSLDETRTSFTGDTVERFFETASAEIIGPTFSKIYDLSGDGRFSKMKHVIEPRIDYGYVGEFEEGPQISVFDEIDSFRSFNGAVFRLKNRLLAKPADESKGGAFEIASFELAQGYNFDDQPGQRDVLQNETSEGPLSAQLRVNPSSDTSLKIEGVYDTLAGGLESASISGGTKIGRHGIGLTYYRNWSEQLVDGESEFVDSRDQLRLFTSFALGSRLTFSSEVSLDLLASETLNQRFVLDWQAACYRWTLELRETNYRGIEERDVRFLLNLKNIGTFLDVNDSF